MDGKAVVQNYEEKMDKTIEALKRDFTSIRTVSYTHLTLPTICSV